MDNKPSLLIVDDHPIVLSGILAFFKGEYNVFAASSLENAQVLLNSEMRFDCLLCDVNFRPSARSNGLKSGFDLAFWYRKHETELRASHEPRMAIVMMTGFTATDYAEAECLAAASGQIDGLCYKTSAIAGMIGTVAGAIWHRTMSLEMQKKRDAVLGSLSEKYLSATQFCGWTSGKDAQSIKLVTKKGFLAHILNVYERPERDDKVWICISPTSGCREKCQMCESRHRKFIRGFEPAEMISQVLWGLRSYQARRIFEKGRTTVINVSMEGEWSRNAESVLKALVILYKELTAKGITVELIITTPGNVKKLRWFLKEYGHSGLPISFHWSLHFTPEMRRLQMPVAAKQDVWVIRDIFCEYFRLTGRVTRIAWAIAPGLNNSEAAAKWLAEFIGKDKDVFVVNVTRMRGGSIEGVRGATIEDRHAFAELLLARGVQCIERENLGDDIRKDCGHAVPDSVVSEIDR